MKSSEALGKIKGKFSDENIAKYRYKNTGEYKCAVCASILHIRSQKTGDLYFAHPKDVFPDCPQRVENSRFSVEDIDAIKNANQKEGKEHILLKRIIEQMIRSDSSFTDCKVEKVIKNMSLLEKSKWRRPDVRGTWKGKEIIFEVQLQTILLHHIIVQV